MNPEDIKENSFALLGSGIGHSISPVIHGEIFACRGDSREYKLADIPESELARTVDIFRHRGVSFNVTIPFKEKIIPLLDGIDASCVGTDSVNTVKNTGGKLTGFSTDGYGFSKSFFMRDLSLEGKKAIILGSGGAARAVCESLLQNGAEVFIQSRNALSAEALLKSFEGLYGGGISLGAHECDILINATPVGTVPGCGVATDRFYGAKVYFDAVYNPVCTKSVILARQSGLTAFGGLDMLIWQAVKSQEIWNGYGVADDEFKAIRRRCERVLEDGYQKKILLTGCMGAGKSTVGRIIAGKLGMDFYDLDDVITESEGRSVPAIFETCGEQGFRKSEHECLVKTLGLSRSVVALGGGTLLFKDNRETIEKSGCFVINLSCGLGVLEKRLSGDNSRPLLKNGGLEKIYSERKDKYIEYSDFSVDAEKKPDAVAEEIYRLLTGV